MKAMVLESPGPIEARPLLETDLPTPVPGPGQVLIRVNVCGVCHTDLHTVEGEIRPSLMPVIPGHQVVGTVERLGPDCSRFAVGDRVGLAWLARTCGRCRFCERGQENLCENIRFHGFDMHGGYAEYVVAYEEFAYRIPDGFPDVEAAPLLCAGIIGYRALRLSGAKPGRTLALYGFGASAHVAIQVAVHRGCRVFVMSRTPSHRELAARLGAEWVGTAGDEPPSPVESAVIFAPAGEIVPAALDVLDKGGTVACAGIYMTPVPELDYERHLYHEKTLRSVANSTRQDGEELLELAATIPIRTETSLHPLAAANDVLRLMKEGGIDGAAVLDVAS